jgi:hypothetical protein
MRSMTIHWGLFVPGVLLLLFPADRLLSSRVELRSFACFQSLENSPRFRPWWWVPVLWLDPLRGFFGAYLLRRAFAIGSTTWELVPKAEYAALVALLAVAVVGQTFTRRGDRGVLLAPLGFVAGIVGALTPWPVALIALVTALLGLFGFRQFHAYFAFGLGAVTLLGPVLDVGMMWIVPAVGVFALPIIAGLVTDSTLELPTRNSAGPSVRTARSI